MCYDNCSALSNLINSHYSKMAINKVVHCKTIYNVCPVIINIVVVIYPCIWSQQHQSKCTYDKHAHIRSDRVNQDLLDIFIKQTWTRILIINKHLNFVQKKTTSNLKIIQKTLNCVRGQHKTYWCSKCGLNWQPALATSIGTPTNTYTLTQKHNHTY